MRLLRRVLVIGLFGIAILAHFTNCGQVQPQPADGATQDCTATGTCPVDAKDLLSISSTVNNVVVQSTDTTMEFGGDCYGSTYPGNAIAWHVYNGSNVEVSGQPYCTFDGGCGQCVNGKFSFTGAQAIRFSSNPVTGWYVLVEIQGVQGGLSYAGDGLGKSILRVDITPLH